ncbi:MAG: S9 family peptidase, partial [Pseudomonadota bacterium]
MHHLIKSAAVLFGLALCAGASAQEEEGAPMSDDPYLWLEEVEGERALDWVRAENARSLGAIEALPLFEPMREEALAILNSDERVPDVSLRGGYAYNFWQDETHVRGLWRRMHQKGYFEGETA